MKMISRMVLAAFGAAALMTGCENSDIDFPDFDGGVSVYFPYQTPIRTLLLGTDEYEEALALDHQHKFKVMATMGGAYSGRNIVLNVGVDESLLKNLTFRSTDELGRPTEGKPLVMLPSNYYKLNGNTIEFKGDVKAGLEVELTDEFFADPLSTTVHYVLPVKITNFTGADRLVTGVPASGITSPIPTNVNDWNSAPKDYTLYAVKYINKYHAYYARLGSDKVTYKGKTETIRDVNTLMGGISHSGADDQIVNTTTLALNKVKYSVETKIGTEGVDQQVLKYDLILTFDNDKCTITSGTAGYTISGSGEYLTKPTGKFTDRNGKDANIWANKLRDVLTLKYTVESDDAKIETEDNLVWQRHGINMPEEYEMVYNK